MFPFFLCCPHGGRAGQNAVSTTAVKVADATNGSGCTWKTAIVVPA